MAACDALNRCLDSLAADYPTVKFCRIRASEARLSINFVRYQLFFLPINNDVSPFLSFHQQCYLSSSDCNKEKLCLKIQKNINYYD